MKSEMFCFQCQETAGNRGCTVRGVCGKSSNTANLQDLLIYATKGLSVVTSRLRAEGKTVDKVTNHYITINLFTTITNANFDDDVFVSRIIETLNMRDSLKKQLTNTADLHDAATFKITTLDEITSKSQSAKVGVLASENEDIDIFLQDTLAKLLDDSLTVDQLVALTLETG